MIIILLEIEEKATPYGKSFKRLTVNIRNPGLLSNALVFVFSSSLHLIRTQKSALKIKRTKKEVVTKSVTKSVTRTVTVTKIVRNPKTEIRAKNEIARRTKRNRETAKKGEIKKTKEVKTKEER